jgi:hypothetical protein
LRSHILKKRKKNEKKKEKKNPLKKNNFILHRFQLAVWTHESGAVRVAYKSGKGDNKKSPERLYFWGFLMYP